MNRHNRRHPTHPLLPILYPSKKRISIPNEIRKNMSVNTKTFTRQNYKRGLWPSTAPLWWSYFLFNL